jgi:hypothetical protein
MTEKARATAKTTTAKSKGGFAISFELRVSSCEFRADSVARHSATWSELRVGMRERKAEATNAG